MADVYHAIHCESGGTEKACQIPIADFKARLSDVVRGLDQRVRPLVVTLNGKPAAVVMSPREFDLLSYRARFLEAVREGMADADAGRVISDDELARRIKQRYTAKPAQHG